MNILKKKIVKRENYLLSQICQIRGEKPKKTSQSDNQLKIHSFTKSQRQAFIQMIMSIGLGDGDWKHFVNKPRSALKNKTLDQFTTYGNSLLQTLLQFNVEDSPYLEGHKKHKVLVRIATLHLIRAKVRDIKRTQQFDINDGGQSNIKKCWESNSPWTKEHDKKLLFGVVEHGWGRWLEIAQDQNLNLSQAINEELSLRNTSTSKLEPTTKQVSEAISRFIKRKAGQLEVALQYESQLDDIYRSEDPIFYDGQRNDIYQKDNNRQPPPPPPPQQQQQQQQPPPQPQLLQPVYQNNHFSQPNNNYEKMQTEFIEQVKQTSNTTDQMTITNENIQPPIITTNQHSNTPPIITTNQQVPYTAPTNSPTSFPKTMGTHVNYYGGYPPFETDQCNQMLIPTTLTNIQKKKKKLKNNNKSKKISNNNM